MIRKSIAVVTTIVATAGLGGSLTPTTAVAATLPATPVTVKDLPKATDLTLQRGRFVVTQQARGEGQHAITLCQTRTWGEFRPNAVFYGEYSVKGDRLAKGYATVASFRSHAAALQAAKAMSAGFTHCGARVTRATKGATSAVSSTRTVKLAGGQVATLVTVNWQAAGWPMPMVSQAAVVVTGTHAELVAIEHGTQARYGDAEILATVRKSVKTLA